MRIVMLGPFGLRAKSTMSQRALPMAKALTRHGHQVSVIMPPWDSPEDAGISWYEEGVEVVNAPLPTSKGTAFYVQLTATLVNLALARKPEVIHLFKPKAFAGLAHVLLLTLRRLRQHNCRLVVDEDDWEQAWNLKNDYTRLQKMFFAWQEPWGLTHADSVTVASKALYRFVASLGVPLHRIRYVPNGVRPLSHPALNQLKTFPTWQEELALVTTARPTCYGLPIRPAKPRPYYPGYGPNLVPDFSDFEGRVRAKYNLFGFPVVLVYTRFVEFDVPFLVAVMEAVRQIVPATHWLVVGQGYFGEQADLESLSEVRGLRDKLTLTGWVDQADLPHYFAAANVAYHPYDDTPINRTKCSVRLLDLLSAGIPVVASRVGQNAEYITHNQTGILVPAQNVLAAAESIAAVLTNTTLQRKLSHRSASYVNKMFNWDSLISRVEAAYAV